MPARTDAAALVEGARALGVTVDQAAAERLVAYLDNLLEVNKTINLTGIRDREQAVVLHVLDSLAVGRLSLPATHCLDIGSGNGFPGIALTALYPTASLVLMERTAKKVRAIDACLLTANLQQVETRCLDAEQAPTRQPDLRSAFDLVTARAVGKPDPLSRLAAPFLRPGGHLVLWVDADETAPDRLGPFRHARTERYELPPPAPRTRQLLCYTRR